jgi:hypothetical protein
MNKKQPITKFLLASGIIVLGTFFLAPYVIPINGLHKETALLKKWISDKFTPNNLPISCAKCKSPYWNIPKK